MRVIEHADGIGEPLRLGYETFWHGRQAFDGMDEREFGALTRVRARQITSMMRHVQISDYEAPPERRGLGLRYIDSDPRPDIHDPEHIRWRISRMLDPSLRFLGAYLLNDSGVISSHPDAMVGMLALQQLAPPADGSLAPVEILELDTRAGYRRRGIATQLMGFGVALVPTETPLLLDVAEPNHGAREHYERRNFAYCYDTDGNLVRSRHKVYDVNHITMHAQPADVRASLVHHGFDAASGTLAESAAAAFRPVMSPPTP